MSNVYYVKKNNFHLLVMRNDNKPGGGVGGGTGEGGLVPFPFKFDDKMF